MRGTFKEPEHRQAYREQWAREIVPQLRRDEVTPLRALIPEGRRLVAMDAGANKGFWSKAFLAEFGDRVAHIYMVDASPENVRELCVESDNMMFSPADLSRVSARHAALGATGGTATLYTNDDGSPLASLYAHKLNGYSDDVMAAINLSQEIVVPMQTVDEIIGNEGIGHLDILKIDVEGYEFQVLRGAENALREHRIDLVTFEFGMHQIEARTFFVDFYRFFLAKGYNLYELSDGELYPVTRYEYRFERFDDNYIFVAERNSRKTDLGPRPTPSRLAQQAMAASHTVYLELNEARKQVAHLQAEAQLLKTAHEQQVAAVTKIFTSSASWRLTAPLRLLKAARRSSK